MSNYYTIQNLRTEINDNNTKITKYENLINSVQAKKEQISEARFYFNDYRITRTQNIEWDNIEYNHNMETHFLKIRHENRGLYGYYETLSDEMENRVVWLDDTKRDLARKKENLEDENYHLNRRIEILEEKDRYNGY